MDVFVGVEGMDGKEFYGCNAKFFEIGNFFDKPQIGSGVFYP
jgi:hypothetical protein